MRHGFQIYDTHTHLGRAHHSGRVCTVDQMLAGMDLYGVDRSLLIPFPVVENYREAHNEIAAAVQAHPDRFTGAACLDPYAPRAEFLAELKRCARDLGFRALKLQPQYDALNPLSPRNDFFFEAAIEYDLTLVVHTGAGAPFALPSLYIAPARKFPALRIVLGHAGGGIYVGEAIVAASVCPNIYIELSSLMPHHVREVLAHVDSSRLMAGSDLPESVEVEIGKILGLEAPAEIKRDILWNTARRVFDGAAA